MVRTKNQHARKPTVPVRVKKAYDALQYSIRGQLNSGEGWCETGYDVEYAPRICVAT